MNKPASRVTPEDEIGPLDENGQQIWTPEEEAAIARVRDDPSFWQDIAKAEADLAAGRVFTHEEANERMRDLRQRFLADRGA